MPLGHGQYPKNINVSCAENATQETVVFRWRSEQESNPHWQYRKLQSYPLNDRSIVFPETSGNEQM